MAELTVYAASPFAFIFRYIRLRPISHAIILTAVLAAVGCSVCTQYGVKLLVDTLSSGENAAAWTAFSVLGALIAAFLEVAQRGDYDFVSAMDASLRYVEAGLPL